MGPRSSRVTTTTLLWLTFGCGTPPSGRPAEPLARPAVAFHCGAAGRWSAVPEIPLRGRVDHTAVWTGTEMIVWGGTQRNSMPFRDGGRYQRAATRWQPTSTTGAPIERDDHVAVWTGSEMIIWGGNSYNEDRDKLDDGARYDPVTDRWTALPSLGLSARDDPRAVWTGTEMIVWGGRDQAGHSATGARYAPQTNTVRPLPARGAPQPREDHTAVWTGTEMIIWGGWNGDDTARNYALDAARFDPRTNRWRPISMVGAPEPREDHTAIWTGTEMIVWGGARRASPADEPTAEIAEDATPEDEGEAVRTRPRKPRGTTAPHQLATGGRYSPATDSWTPLTLVDAPTPREDDAVVWTGTEMIVWGGQQSGQPLQTGARYVPAADTWCPMSAVNAPVARRDHAGVWTGDTFVVWGGAGTEREFLATGAAFTP